jgi:hypothetical protein
MSISDELPRKLERLSQKLGFCPDCETHYEHHLDEPFASCACHTTEWSGPFTPFMQLQIQLEEAEKNGRDG